MRGRADRRGLGGLGLGPPGRIAMSRTAKSHGHRGRADRRGLGGLGLGPPGRTAMSRKAKSQQHRERASVSLRTL